MHSKKQQRQAIVLSTSSYSDDGKPQLEEFYNDEDELVEALKKDPYLNHLLNEAEEDGQPLSSLKLEELCIKELERREYLKEPRTASPVKMSALFHSPLRAQYPIKQP